MALSKEQRDEIWDYEEEIYVIDKFTNEKKELTFAIADFADNLIEKLSGKQVCTDFPQEEYDKWLQTIYDKFHSAVAYYYSDSYEFPDIENEIYLGKIRKYSFNKNK